MSQATQTADSFSKEWNQSLMSKIPAKGSSKALVEARAHMADYVNNLTPDMKTKLLSNPIAFRAMVDAVESTPQLQQSAVGQMLQPVQQMMNPSKQNPGQ
jgi:hypothetical protein